jgi:serine/threonine-protein phosphatase PGAM5
MLRKAPKTEPLHFVHLIRHGQYVLQPPDGDGPLTAIGRKQAAIAGRYLARLPIARVWCSDAERATETAEILIKRLDVENLRKTTLLREVMPSAVPGMDVPAATRRQGREAIEEVLTTFFVPLAVTRHDLLVCHGNLIRSLVCRVIGGDQFSWLKLATHHCALTSFVIRGDRGIALVRYGESAYLLNEELLTDH